MSNNVENLSSFVPTPFWKENPKLYFAHIEYQFAFCGIFKDETKYNLLISTFEAEILSQVRDIVFNPPATDKYETLKSRLIEQFTESETVRIKQLLHGLQLESDRPSQLLRKMRDLSIEVPEDVLKMIWLMRLPTEVVNILEDDKATDLDSLSKMADRVMDVIVTSSTPLVKAKECDGCVTLQKQVDDLTKEIQDLRVSQLYGRRSRSYSRSRFFQCPSPPSTSDSDSAARICWYHYNFGFNAHKCIHPCDYYEGIA